MGKVIPLYDGMKNTICENPDDHIKVIKREAVIFCTMGAALGFTISKKLKINPLIGIVIGPALFYYGLYALHNLAENKNIKLKEQKN